MIYVCNKQMYDSIAILVTKKDLQDSKKSLYGWMLSYFNGWLNLPEDTITEIRFK